MSKFIGLAALGLSIFGLKEYYGGAQCFVTRDLTGKVAIITGGNTGIGKETAIGLAQKGCEVIIAARDVQKSMEAVSQIKQKTQNNKIHFLPLDLGNKQSVNTFTSQIEKQFNQINILVNNAGVMRIPERRQTKDGFQMQFGINHLGHFYLTSKLWQLMKKSKDLRIVNVSSTAHRRVVFDKNKVVDLDWNNLNFTSGYSSGLAYSRSKLANVLFTQQLAQRLSKTHPDARCVCLHPGVVKTQIGRYSFQGYKKYLMTALSPITYIFFKNSWQGAQTTIYTVMQSSSKLTNDKNKNPFADNPENQKKLWQLSQEMLGIKFNPN